MTHFLKRILGVYLVPYWKQGLLLLGCFATLIAFDTVFPLGIKFLIDLAITPKNGRMLWLIIAGLAVLYLVSSFGGIEFRLPDCLGDCPAHERPAAEDVRPSAKPAGQLLQPHTKRGCAYPLQYRSECPGILP